MLEVDVVNAVGLVVVPSYNALPDQGLQGRRVELLRLLLAHDSHGIGHGLGADHLVEVRK